MMLIRKRLPMRVRKPARFPAAKIEMLKRAERLQWIDLFFRVTIIVALFFTAGNSKAMQATLLDDVFGFLAPAGWLIARRIQDRDPNEGFPFGYHRAVNIAFLSSSLALLALGLYLLYDSVATLAEGKHPTIGGVEIFGVHIWQGWLMIAALVYSMIPGVVIGTMVQPLAEGLHDKALFTNSRMNKAEWTTAGAAVAGIIGIGFGFWWADAAAALVIGADVLRDGAANLWAAVKDLADQEPSTVAKHEPDPVVIKVKEAVEAMPWVRQAEVSLREEGQLLTGVIYVVPKTDEKLVPAIEKAVADIEALDWRLHEISIMPLRSLR